MQAPDTILLTLTQAEYVALVEVLRRYMSMLANSQFSDKEAQLVTLSSIASKTLEAIRATPKEEHP